MKAPVQVGQQPDSVIIAVHIKAADLTLVVYPVEGRRANPVRIIDFHTGKRRGVADNTMHQSRRVIRVRGSDAASEH